MSVEAKQKSIICHECGLKVDIPDLPNCHRALCPRCGFKLYEFRHDAEEKILVFALTALIFLLLALPFEFMSFSAAGREQVISVPDSIDILISNDYLSLAILQFLVIILLPATILLSVMYLIYCKRTGKRAPHIKHVIDWMYRLLPWSMAEIFLVGVLVSLIKIVSLADVALGFSFFAFMCFVLFKTAMLLHLDKQQVYDWFDLDPHHHEEHQGKRAISIQSTWAMLLTASLLYIPANVWPIMQTNMLGQVENSTIMGGVILLWNTGSIPIALVIFLFSVVIPSAKLVILAWLNYEVQHNKLTDPKSRIFWYRFTEFVGKWSMLDVFVVAVLVSLVQLGNAMSIYPGPAAIAFAGVVIATMLAAHSFEPKAMWADEENK